MSLTRYLILFIGLCLGACQSSQPQYEYYSDLPYSITNDPSPPSYYGTSRKSKRYLYPSQEQQDLTFVCNQLYSILESPRRPFFRESPPELVIATEDTVTVYFRNDNTQTFKKPESVDLPRGTYRCP